MKNKIILLFVLMSLLNLNHVHSREITLMELEEVTDQIMSPGCKYVYTLTNCPSSEAEQMRELIRDRLVKGESKEEILEYFAGVYGPKILAQPSTKGFYSMAWWFPYFLLFDVVVLVGIFLYLWRRKYVKPVELSAELGSEMEDELEDEIRRFREGE